MSFKLTILGCNAATPTSNSYPTAQYLQFAERYFLIDCGEGTQVQLRKYKAKFNKIHHVFISHLHGDHFFGLIGLISTFQLLGRVADLHIYGPKGIKEIIEVQLRLTQSYKTYTIYYHELESKESELIFKDDLVEVHTIPLKHRVYCNGYLFKEKLKKRKVNMEAVSQYSEIEICDYQNLKNGKDYVLESGAVIQNEKLTLDPPKPLSYAFCSDTSFNPTIIPLIENVDLLYHEATFLEDKKSLAQKTGHSTALEAAQIAQKSNVKKLILGHYSNRYSDLNDFKEEAQKVFENVVLGHEGKEIVVK
ncbi:ribonuclease Z [Flavobacteriaceae bacterium UJ101]|nr:ribonuclease Z [Flavobacteriaceae bacterium UJ101]